MTDWEKYFELQKEYELFYSTMSNKKVVVINQVGIFCEIYEYDPEICINDLNDKGKIDSSGKIWNNKIGYAKEISDILHLIWFPCYRRLHGINNPFIVGFPIINFEKNLKILLKNDFIIVKFEQNKANPSENGCVTEIINSSY